MTDKGSNIAWNIMYSIKINFAEDIRLFYWDIIFTGTVTCRKCSVKDLNAVDILFVIE